MLADFLNFMLGGVFDFLNGLISILPPSPFDAIMDMLQTAEIVITILGWMNWFLPFEAAGTITGLWIVALFAYVSIKIGFKYGGALVGGH